MDLFKSDGEARESQRPLMTQWHTPELELYLKGKPASVAGIMGEETEVAAVPTRQDQIMEMLQSIIEHMDHLEASAVTPDKGARPKADRQTETCVTCKCGWSRHAYHCLHPPRP